MKDVSEMTREELLDVLGKCKQKLEPLNAEINEIFEIRDIYYEREDQISSLVGPSSIIGKVLLSIVKLWFFFAVFTIPLALIFEEIPGALFGEAGEAVSTATSLLGVFLGTVLAIYVTFKKAIKRKLLARGQKDLWNQMQQAQNKLDNNHKKIIAENSEIFSAIPEKYQSYDIISSFYDYINDRRADSLKEAINLFEA